MQFHKSNKRKENRGTQKIKYFAIINSKGIKSVIKKYIQNLFYLNKNWI
jgi:hypothetical protein